MNAVVTMEFALIRFLVMKLPNPLPTLLTRWSPER
jgi:hypothetical protein